MSKFLIFLILFSARISLGAITLWPAVYSLRTDRDEFQNTQFQSAQQFSLALQIQSWSLEFGRTEFDSSSEEGNIFIKEKYEDSILWLGYHFKLLEELDLVISGGIRTYQEKITTTVGLISNRSESEQEMLTGIAGELRWKPFDLGFLLSSGIRVLMAENFDPNPQPEFFVRAGWMF